MKKRIGSLLLILALCFTLLPTAAFAEGTSVDNWDGSADTSWYTDHKTDTEYHFTTAEQLAGLAQLVNDKTASVSFEGKTIYLDNDLDLSGCQWTPIGNGGNILLVLLMGSITKSRICIITLLVTNLFETDFSELFLTVVH